MNILDTMATGPGSYSGNQLSSDAEQYSQDEQDYNPDGTVDTAYAQPLMQDIIALERDCPQGAEMGAAVTAIGAWPDTNGYLGDPVNAAERCPGLAVSAMRLSLGSGSGGVLPEGDDDVVAEALSWRWALRALRLRSVCLAASRG